jgi:hypothetical protein
VLVERERERERGRERRLRSDAHGDGRRLRRERVCRLQELVGAADDEDDGDGKRAESRQLTAAASDS